MSNLQMMNDVKIAYNGGERHMIKSPDDIASVASSVLETEGVYALFLDTKNNVNGIFGFSNADIPTTAPALKQSDEWGKEVIKLGYLMNSIRIVFVMYSLSKDRPDVAERIDTFISSFLTMKNYYDVAKLELLDIVTYFLAEDTYTSVREAN